MRLTPSFVAMLTVAAATTVAVPLALPSSAAASGGAEVSATLVLTAPVSDTALAASSGLPRVARLQRLALTLPPADEAATVQARAAALGAQLQASTLWSLSVRGTQAAISDLSTMPQVAQVLSGGPAPTAAATQTPVAGPLPGAELRDAYDASGSKPPTGTTAPIVATLQFSGWNSSELPAYVSNANSELHYGLPVPPAGTFAALSADGSSTTAAGPYSAEFALDQESIYAVAPYAQQRAYVGSPSPAGMVAALDKVASNAATMPGLVALSISYGWCIGGHFGDEINADQEAAIHQSLGHVVAAGVTVFASTGDTGGQCDGTTAVSYPAADPQVVAVGGTSLTVHPTAETAWPSSGGGIANVPAGAAQAQALNSGKRELPDIAADANLDTGFFVWHDKGDGNGETFDQAGGTSLATAVSAAAYTAELGSRGAANGGLGDISGVLYSSPATDFRDITGGAALAKPGYDLVTGRGAPLWAPLVDRLLTQPVLSVPPTSASRTVPVTVTTAGGQGFSAWADGFGTPPACGSPAGRTTAAALAPVTVPTDGTFQVWAQGWVGGGHCFTVSTTTTVTTAAAPTIVATPVPAPVIADVTAPTAVVTAKQKTAASTAISYSWHAADGQGSGLASVVVTVLKDGRPVWRRTVAPSGRITLTGAAGHAYRLSVLAVDRAGNAAAHLSGTVRLPLPATAFAVGRGWVRVAAARVLGGRALHSSTKGASAALTATAGSFTLLAATGPAEGVLSVYVDGHHVRDISLYAPHAGHANVTLARFAKAGRHRITLRVKGSHVAKARGTLVIVEGLLVS